MNSRCRRLIAAVLAMMTIAGLVFQPRIQPQPSLAEIARLAETGDLSGAEARLDLFLERQSIDPTANLLAAQIKMNKCEQTTNSGIGTDPRPAESALAYLRRAASPDRKVAALVKLWQGKAERYLGQLDEAEDSWLEALELDPLVPEAGWLLLQEYYLQGRAKEVRSLALRLHQIEPDRRDRDRLLLEPLRQDFMPPDPSSLVLWFEPIALRYPDSLRTNVALGLALVRSNKVERGMHLLRKMVEVYPRRSEAWNALLAGLDEVSDVMQMSDTINQIPAVYATESWIFKYKGRVAEANEDWQGAASDYRRALQESPTDVRLLYWLALTLRRTGDKAESERVTRRHHDREALIQEAQIIYENFAKDDRLGIPHDPKLYERIAAHREKMGYPEQAEAWLRLAKVTRLRN